MNSSTANKQKGIQLIPFTVDKVVEQVNEIPPVYNSFMLHKYGRRVQKEKILLLPY